MSRDSNLITLLLKEGEGQVEPDFTGYSESQRAEECKLLKDDGFVEAGIVFDGDGKARHYKITRLTSRGHDALKMMTTKSKKTTITGFMTNT